jgi:4a-hydroxytetrahydrobiopterin dehydratase
MSRTLSPKEIERELLTLPGWRLQDDRLKKTYQFNSFREAISFIVRMAFTAEEHDHHPDLRNVYNRVEVSLATHDAGDVVTDRDIAVARDIEAFSWV